MLISIITIAYNSEKTIERTINSVINQKNCDIEYIIIDGASTDATNDIINKYKDQIDVMISEKDNGITDAFNKGIKLAKGEIIGLINSDDMLLPGSGEKLTEAYCKSVDVFYGDWITNDENNNRKFLRKAEKLDAFQDHLPFSHQSCFVSRKAYEQYGLYSDEYKICMDYDLLIKMYKDGAKFRYVEYPLAEFSFGGTSYSKPFSMLRENIGIAMNHGLPIWRGRLYKFKYLNRHYLKIILEKFGLFKYVARIKDKA